MGFPKKKLEIFKTLLVSICGLNLIPVTRQTKEIFDSVKLYGVQQDYQNEWGLL